MVSKRTDISQQVKKYLNGELDARAMHQLERQAQYDPFLRDALEGYEVEGIDHDKNLKELASWLENRVANKERRIIPIRFIAVAAIILIFLFAGLLWYLGSPSVPEKPIAKVKYAPEIKKPAADTLLAPVKKTEIATLVKKKPQHKVNSPVAEMVAPNMIAAADNKVRHAKSNPNADVTIDEPVGNSDAKVTEADPTEVKPDSAYLKRIAKYNSATAKERIANSYSNYGLLKGVVKDETNQPIPGATVIVKGTNKAATTDANGRFVLPGVGNDATLDVAFIGYNIKEINVKKPDSLVIAMQPNTSSLNEVVVTGYGTKKSNFVTDQDYEEAHPVKGWSDFKKYLNDNAVSPDGKKGVVRLSFKVNADGSLSDFKIRKSLGSETDNAAVQLIQDGPRWLSNTDHVAETVIVRIRFKAKQ